MLFFIVQVNLSHVKGDVLLYLGVADCHENLSFASHFIHDIIHDFGAQNDSISFSKSEVEQDILDDSVLIELSSGMFKLLFLIQLVQLFLSLLSEINRFNGLKSSALVNLIAFEATYWDDLTKHQKLDVLDHVELSSEVDDESVRVPTLDPI